MDRRISVVLYRHRALDTLVPYEEGAAPSLGDWGVRSGTCQIIRAYSVLR